MICVPSGNFGNITAGLFGKRMGLPISRFIAANNRNDVFFEYLKTGEYKPRPSVQTIANAMDVGDPSNFARVLDLYGHSHEAICKDISGCTYNDDQIRTTIKEVFGKYHYLLDPHGAVGYQALAEHIRPEENGVFLETAHPAKFRDTVEPIVGKVEIPAKLQAFMRGTKQSIELPKILPLSKLSDERLISALWENISSNPKSMFAAYPFQHRGRKTARCSVLRRLQWQSESHRPTGGRQGR